MSLLQAFLIALCTGVIGWAESHFAFPMLALPIVLGPVAGAILGDVQAGVLCGVACQLVFLGGMGIGGTAPPDAIGGTMFGTALAISMGQGAGFAMLIGLIVGYIGQIFTKGSAKATAKIIPRVDKLVEEGDYKAIERYHRYLCWKGTLRSAPINFVLLFALGNAVKYLRGLIPLWISHGLTIAVGLVAAVGIAALMRTLWSKKLGIYFFVGFLLAAVFRVPMIAIACIGVVLVIILYVENGTGKKEQAAVAASASGEEELFND